MGFSAVGARALARRLTVGASVLALGVADAALAQQACDAAVTGPCLINNTGTMGQISGAQGQVTFVTNSGVIAGAPAISQGQSLSIQITNLAGGVITGQDGVAIVGQAPHVSFTVSNAGSIDGDLVFTDTPPLSSPYTASIVRYVADGGTLNGNLQLGSIGGYSSALFVQRGATSGVTGTISAGDGVDTYAKSYSTSQSVAVGQYQLPDSFEIEGYEVLGADTVLTLTGTSTTISLLGNGQVVNNATINLLDTSSVYPDGVTVIPPAISYASPYLSFYQRSGFAPNAAGAFVGVPLGDALTSFTNNGAINGDIQIATASFVNNGSISFGSNTTGSAIYAAADKAFVFRNAGTITMTDSGPRLRKLMV